MVPGLRPPPGRCGACAGPGHGLPCDTCRDRAGQGASPRAHHVDQPGIATNESAGTGATLDAARGPTRLPETDVGRQVRGADELPTGKHKSSGRPQIGKTQPTDRPAGRPANRPTDLKHTAALSTQNTRPATNRLFDRPSCSNFHAPRTHFSARKVASTGTVRRRGKTVRRDERRAVMKWTFNTALLDAAWPAFCSWSLCHLASEKRRALAQKGTGMSKKGLQKGDREAEGAKCGGHDMSTRRRLIKLWI